MSIRSELLNIQHADPENILHAANVVEWARDNPESALHNSLEWDDQKAAESHRFWQVRQLIQLHIVTEDRKPLLVSLSIDRVAGGGYRNISDVVKVPELREIMLRDALVELERAQEKYKRVAALEPVWKEVEAVRLAQQQKGRQRRGARQTADA